MGFHSFIAYTIDDEALKMETFKGKVLVVVNTASKCGFTPQFEALERIYQTYKDRGFVVLGFPCDQFANQEYDDGEAIKSFCQLNYGVSFPMFQKVQVNGPNEHPIYRYLKSQKGSVFGKKIKLNFTKFLIDQEGKVVKRYGPAIPPEKMIEDIERLLKAKED